MEFSFLHLIIFGHFNAFFWPLTHISVSDALFNCLCSFRRHSLSCFDFHLQYSMVWDKANALGVHSETHITIFVIQKEGGGVGQWEGRFANMLCLWSKTRRSTSSWFHISATSNHRKNHRKHVQIEVMQGSGATTNQGWEQQPRQKGWKMMVHCYSIIIQEKYP